MSLLNVSDLCFRHESRPEFLFQCVTFEINPRDRVGLIGPNGSGKSTLLRVLTGELAAHSGQVARRRDLRVGYIPQESVASIERSVEDHVFASFTGLFKKRLELRQLEDGLQNVTLANTYAALLADYELQGGFQAEVKATQVLEGLGFDARERVLPMAYLSSGQRARAELARLLLTPADLLLVDEPTNHLDIAARQWLEDYLSRLESAYLLASHDRQLLVQATNRTFDLRRGSLSVFEGDYAYCREQRLLKDRQALQQYEAQQRRRAAARHTSERRMVLSRKVSRTPTGQRHCKDFYGHKAAKVARTARILKERVEREPAASKPWVEQPIPDLEFPNVARSGDPALRCEGISKAYDGKRLFRDLSFSVGRGERCAIVGPNGCGKTTLLRLLLGLEVPDTGAIHLGTHVTLGYLAQQAENLEPSNSAVALCRNVYDNETWVRTFLGCLRIRGQLAEQPVGSMSLGERSKVGLARLLLSGVNVLLLDEPTNHLDIDAREAVEETLAEFPGTILFVTHDPFFLERLADKSVTLGP
ncbi:MAG TPA: ABC-F family ATP-binding cassette domain-containing protein [Terriglobia bacterium]|nr:ABC-F family ATP-binding cassette domain-containing protein [Terriglobia bacterium]